MRSFVPRWQALAAVAVLLLALAMVLGTTATASAANERVEVFIGFDRTPGGSEHAIVRAAGGEVRHSYTIVDAVAAFVPQSAISGLERNPRVSYVEPVTLAHALDHPTGDEELDRGWGVAHIGSGMVHASSNTGAAVSIAIIDTGISNAHPDLGVAGGRNFLNNSDQWNDDNGHGTHVAGTACARANGFGVVGVAADCELYALKVLDSGGSGAWSGIIAAVEWAASNNIQVANLSLGSRFHPGTTAEQAFANAYADGLLIVAAAGNDGNCGGNNESVEYPGRFASVIAVAATNESNVRPCFSSTGAEVELAAPGVSVMSTWPGATSRTSPQPVLLCDGDGENCAHYKLGSGTSMSAPHVAGVAALVLAANPGMSNESVRAALTDSAINIGAAHRYGAGLVSAPGAVGAEPPPPPATGAIAGTVTDAESGDPIAGATVAVDTGESTLTGADGTYLIEAVEVGERTVSASADGYGAASQPVIVEDGETATADFALDEEADDPEPPPAEGTATVASISYSTHGGPQRNRHLTVTLAVEDGDGGAVSGAAVTGELYRNGDLYGTFSGTTNGDGTVSTSANNAPSGTYTTVVKSVVADGLEWDGETPTNSFTK